MRRRRGPAGVLPAVAVAAGLACALSGCSPELAFPAVHDMPPPRADTPLTPDQVKQATDDLISERNHLSAETQAASAATDAAAQNTGTIPAAPAKPAKKKKMAPSTAAPITQAAAQPALSNATQTAGADVKP